MRLSTNPRRHTYIRHQVFSLTIRLYAGAIPQVYIPYPDPPIIAQRVEVHSLCTPSSVPFVVISTDTSRRGTSPCACSNGCVFNTCVRGCSQLWRVLPRCPPTTVFPIYTYTHTTWHFPIYTYTAIYFYIQTPIALFCTYTHHLGESLRLPTCPRGV